MKTFCLGLTVLGIWLLQANPARAERAELVVLEVSATDAEDTARLRELLDRPLRSVRLSEPAEDPVAAARRLHVAEVLILDRARGRVSLVKVSEAEVLTRETGSGAQRSPYAISFVAAELLALSAQLDEARAHRFGVDALLLRAGLEGRWARAAHERFLRPALGLGLSWGRPKARLSLVTQLEASLWGHAERNTELGQVQFVRHDLALGLGLAARFSPLVVRLMSQAGLGFIRADYAGPFGAAQRHTSGSVGGDLELQVNLLPWLSAFAKLGASLALERADYRVAGESVAREAPWLGRAGAGLNLVFPAR